MNTGCGICVGCGNPTAFISPKKGYKKTCSRECFNAINRARFKKLSETRADQTLQHSADIVHKNKDQWVKLYTKDGLTIREVAKQSGHAYGMVRNYLSTHTGYTQTHNKCADVIRRKNDALFANANLKLDDENWVNNKIACGYGGKQFAEELGCSADYVASYLREAGRPLLKNKSHRDRIYETAKVL
jgi:DNA-binding CsgD family transcriptional regulator